MASTPIHHFSKGDGGGYKHWIFLIGNNKHRNFFPKADGGGCLKSNGIPLGPDNLYKNSLKTSKDSKDLE